MSHRSSQCYWPDPDNRGTPEIWRESIEGYRKDLKAMETLVADDSSHLYEKIPHGDGQTLLREALLVADHNAYHLGVLAVMSRIVQARE